jgi:excisionase family DNA binding protein
MSVIRLPAGQNQGAVAPQIRIKSGESRGAQVWKSSALLTIKDVAALTQVSYWTARGWIETGKLPVMRLPGRLIRIRPAALERFLVETECRP